MLSAYKPGGYEYKEKGGVVVMEAGVFAGKCTQGNKTGGQLSLTCRTYSFWFVVDAYTQPVTGASLTYRMF